MTRFFTNYDPKGLLVEDFANDGRNLFWSPRAISAFG